MLRTLSFHYTFTVLSPFSQDIRFQTEFCFRAVHHKREKLDLICRAVFCTFEHEFKAVTKPLWLFPGAASLTPRNSKICQTEGLYQRT